MRGKELIAALLSDAVAREDAALRPQPMPVPEVRLTPSRAQLLALIDHSRHVSYASGDADYRQGWADATEEMAQALEDMLGVHRGGRLD